MADDAKKLEELEQEINRLKIQKQRLESETNRKSVALNILENASSAQVPGTKSYQYEQMRARRDARLAKNAGTVTASPLKNKNKN